MAKIKYESGNGETTNETIIFEVEDELVESCIDAEFETAKREFIRNCDDYDYADYPSEDGKICTVIWNRNGDWIRWSEL